MFVVAVHTDTDHFESGRIICDTGALQRRIWTPAVVLKVRAEVCKSLVYVYVHQYNTVYGFRHCSSSSFRCGIYRCLEFLFVCSLDDAMEVQCCGCQL